MKIALSKTSVKCTKNALQADTFITPTKLHPSFAVNQAIWFKWISFCETAKGYLISEKMKNWKKIIGLFCIAPILIGLHVAVNEWEAIY